VDRRVANDLAAALVAFVGGKSIFKNSDVIVGLRDFSFRLAWTRGAQRTVLGGRMIRAILTPRGNGDPFFKKGMPAKFAIRQVLVSQLRRVILRIRGLLRPSCPA